MNYDHYLDGNLSNESSMRLTSSGNNGGGVSLDMLMSNHSKEVDLQELRNGMVQ